jgi:galactokinase
VSGDTLGDVLVRVGFAADDAASRAVLIESVQRRFVECVGSQGSWCWFVPGRIEVLGKHTDYAGGRSLVAAVPRGFAVVAGPRTDQRVRVFDAVDGAVALVDLNEKPIASTNWTSYVSVVARRLAANFIGAELGVDVVIASDLPRAAGLSSSSALVVGIATAMIRRGALIERLEWQRAITSVHDLAWYLGSVESGGDYPGLLGSPGVGTSGGSEDHTAILACCADYVSENRYIPVAPIDEVAFPRDWTFVVATSGVKADKAGAVRDRYNRLSAAIEALRSLWNDATGHRPVTSLAAALRSSTDAEATLRSLVARAFDSSIDPVELDRRLTHFVREDTRVPEAAHAIAAADHWQLGELAAASQRDADTLLGNQIAETRELVQAALDGGAWAASSFGAGFGGSAWALVPRDDGHQFAHRWVADYVSRCPHVRDAQSFVARPAPALLEVVP